jgi:hypothetical protein
MISEHSLSSGGKKRQIAKNELLKLNPVETDHKEGRGKFDDIVKTQ